MKPKMKTREICQYIHCGQTEVCDSECYIKRLEAENAELVQKWNKLEAENATLNEQLAAANKRADAAAEDFESAAHTGNDFCEFCSADCIDAGNDYVQDTHQCGMFKYNRNAMSSAMKIGDKVKMNSKYYVSGENKEKIWTVRSEPWECSGTMVVLLEGKSGGYAVDGLDIVDEGR